MPWRILRYIIHCGVGYLITGATMATVLEFKDPCTSILDAIFEVIVASVAIAFLVVVHLIIDGVIEEWHG